MPLAPRMPRLGTALPAPAGGPMLPKTPHHGDVRPHLRARKVSLAGKSAFGNTAQAHPDAAAAFPSSLGGGPALPQAPGVAEG